MSKLNTPPCYAQVVPIAGNYVDKFGCKVFKVGVIVAWGRAFLQTLFSTEYYRVAELAVAENHGIQQQLEVLWASLLPEKSLVVAGGGH